MKKFLCLIVSIIGIGIGFVGAQTIYFEPQGDGVFGYDCVVPIDVYINTNGQEISAIDLIMESSMNYVDFVPSNFVPYFFKPIIREDGLIHIVGFTVEPSERVNGEGMIGTIYFSQKQGNIDGLVSLYFLGEGETIDTNLGIAGGIDVLKNVGQAYVKFSKDLPSCKVEIIETSLDEEDVHVENVITGGFANLTYDEALENTVKTIDKKYGSMSSFNILKNSVIWILLIFILLIIIILLLKKEKNKGNKNAVKQ